MTKTKATLKSASLERAVKFGELVLGAGEGGRPVPRRLLKHGVVVRVLPRHHRVLHRKDDQRGHFRSLLRRLCKLKFEDLQQEPSFDILQVGMSKIQKKQSF